MEKSPSDITGHVSYKIQHKAANCQLPTAYCQRNLAAGSWLSFMEYHSFFQLKRIFVFLIKNTNKPYFEQRNHVLKTILIWAITYYFGVAFDFKFDYCCMNPFWPWPKVYICITLQYTLNHHRMLEICRKKPTCYYILMNTDQWTRK